MSDKEESVWSSDRLSVLDVDWHEQDLFAVLEDVKRLNTEFPLLLSMTLGANTHLRRPLRNRYLDLMSALESYHSIVFGVGETTLEEHKLLKSTVLAKVSASEALDSSERKFLKRNLNGRPAKALFRRLKDLYDLIETPAHKRLAVEALANLRNDIAHGEEPDARYLRLACDEAEDMARRVILKEINVELVDPVVGGSQ